MAEELFNEKDGQALSTLPQNAYWQRIWIIQEVSVAKRVLVCCGGKELNWPFVVDLVGLYGVYEKEQKSFALNESGLGRVLSINDSRTWLIKMDGSELLYMLTGFRKSQCSDPRDKVNGLLGLAKAQEVVGLRPDYSLSVEEVYCRTASHIIRTSRSLDVLAVCSSSPGSQILPSWVPDWRDSDVEPEFTNGLADIACAHGQYSASAQTELTFQTFENGTTLHLKAVEFAGVLDSGTWRGLSKQGLQSLEETVIGALRALRGPFYNSAESSRMAFRRTLLADTLNGKRLDAREYARYSAWFDLKEDVSDPLWRPLSAVVSEDWFWTVGRDTFHDAIAVTTLPHCLFVTIVGLIGLSPRAVRRGDLVCIAHGARVPYMVRPSRGKNHHLVGECYVHGIMDGEVFEGYGAEDFKYKVQDIFSV